MTFEDLRRVALAFPGVEEGVSYGEPSFKLRGKFFCRLRPLDGLIVLPIGYDEREMLMQAEPETFSITPHYAGSSYVLAKLPTVAPGTVARLLEQAWRAKAIKSVVAAYDAARGGAAS